MPNPIPMSIVVGQDDRPTTAEALWQEMVEWDDRTSPEEYPEMAMLTFEEFADFLSRHAESARRKAIEEALQALHERLPYPTEACAIVRALSPSPTPIIDNEERAIQLLANEIKADPTWQDAYRNRETDALPSDEEWLTRASGMRTSVRAIIKALQESTT